MPDIACVNGVFSPLDDARVPVNDRGFLFGDGVYEAIRSYDGRLWALDRHMVRLERSLAELMIPLRRLSALRTWIQEAMERANYPDAIVYVQVTRGAAARQHAFDETLVPTVVVTVRPVSAILPEQRAAGVSAITTPDLRWERRDIKSINLLPNVLAKQQAVRAGAFEALLVEPDGRMTEGSSSNLFAVFEGRVHTAPADHHILGGITRDLVIAVAARIGIVVEESPFSLDRLRSADEIFLSGTVSEVLAVTRLDGAPVGTGAVGPLTHRLADGYNDCVRSQQDCLPD
ncbi:MAG: aminotransferase class IV [Chloroflexi bacterium]|nr:aminotransferase class IV [Chloroflexota bacterium]